MASPGASRAKALSARKIQDALWMNFQSTDAGDVPTGLKCRACNVRAGRHKISDVETHHCRAIIQIYNVIPITA
eukprot:CAMPEP_0115156524 /NCGR_PEP_ID=MMETSP0227-20121206/68493_1 /TAXON_ID=89957 /ORGANISM="Polarella glacialis, Strain CCMP 1383" /LENGTH=73 /DNA_ID=CAMNT_0002567711 /DNA_START=64 /DNA_END=284 /DNA_ORIENTATION=-